MAIYSKGEKRETNQESIQIFIQINFPLCVQYAEAEEIESMTYSIPFENQEQLEAIREVGIKNGAVFFWTCDGVVRVVGVSSKSPFGKEVRQLREAWNGKPRGRYDDPPELTTYGQLQLTTGGNDG